MKTNREWWIEFLGDPLNDTENYKRYVSGIEFETISPSDEVIHVIEKKAYDDILKQTNLLVDALSYLYETNKSDLGIDEFDILEDSSALGVAKKTLSDWKKC